MVKNIRTTFRWLKTFTANKIYVLNWRMAENIPTAAFDLLSLDEKEAVQNYLEYVKSESLRKNERIALFLARPIPGELVKRSKSILNRPLVLAALSDLLRTLSDESDLSPHRLIRDIGYIAHANIGDFLTREDFGMVRIDISKASREQLSAVKSFKIIPTPYGNREEIQLYDKQPAQAILAEMMKLVKNPESSAPAFLTPPAPPAVALSENPEKAYSEILNG